MLLVVVGLQQLIKQRDAPRCYSRLQYDRVVVCTVVEFQKNEGDETLIEFLARNLCPASLLLPKRQTNEKFCEWINNEKRHQNKVLRG